MQIDYLFGRKATAVEEGGADGAVWSIVLEGGARIVVFDQGYTMPDGPQIDGLSLNAYDSTGGQMRLFFGTNENPLGTMVSLPVGKYGISDDTYTHGEVINPDAVASVQALPPDPEEQRRQEANQVEEPSEDG